VAGQNTYLQEFKNNDQAGFNNTAETCDFLNVRSECESSLIAGTWDASFTRTDFMTREVIHALRICQAGDILNKPG
jgi:hypothetical protein